MQLPALAWLRTYDRAWLRTDVTAGITLAAYLLPAAIGDASLAGLPPQAGLYACLFGGLVFWLFCSSKQTTVTVTSAISLLIGASLADMTGGDPTRHAALAACVALMVAAMAFIAYAAKAGAIVNFFSETVLAGFKCGVAFFLASTQLPKLFGFSGSHGGDFWDRMGHFFHGLHQTNPVSLMLGLIALGLLLLGKTILKNRPVALVVVLASIGAAGCCTSTSAEWRCSVRCRADCRYRRCRQSVAPISTRCSRWPWPALSSPPSRLRRSGGCSGASTATGSMRPRNSSPSAPPISPPGSDAGFRSAAACRSRW
jgi:MFS superfamily sulfate permease-like transporter